MCHPSFHLLVLALLVTLSLTLAPVSSHAISFTVAIDTRPLAGQATPPAPFSLEFQLNDGDGTVNNTVTLSNFDFGVGGGPAGSPTTQGGASGNLSGKVVLTDSSFFNEFKQEFTPSGAGPLSFLIDLTNNVEPITPDAFSLAILDSLGKGIPTNFFDVFLQIDITDPPTINTYASDPSASSIAIDAPNVTATPEPATVLLLVTGLVVLLFCDKQQQKPGALD